MKRFKQLLFKKLTLGLVLSVLGSLAYAVVLKLSFEQFFNIYPIKGGISVIDLSYFLSIVTWKLIFNVLLELLLGDNYYAPIMGYKDENSSTVLKMGKSKNITADNGESSSSSTKAPVVPSNTLDAEGYDDLCKETFANIDTQYDMVKRLRNLKLSNDLKYYNNKGALEFGVPGNLNDTEVSKLTKEIGIIDRIYNTKCSEYKKLIKKDSRIGPQLESLRQQVKDNYEGLFDK